MQDRRDTIALHTPAPLPSPAELSAAPDYAIHGPADNAALRHGARISEQTTCASACDNDLGATAYLRSLAWATRFTYPYLPALLGVIEPALHELVGQGQGTRMSRH